MNRYQVNEKLGMIMERGIHVRECPDHLGSIWVCTACNTIHSVIVDRVKRVFQTGIIKAIYNPFLDKVRTLV